MHSKRKQSVPALQELKIKLKRCDSSTPSLHSLTCSDSPKVLDEEKQYKGINESLDLLKVDKPSSISNVHKIITRNRGTAVECLMSSPKRKTRHLKSKDCGQNWRVAETGDLKELRANRFKGKESESRSDSRPKSKKSVNSVNGLKVKDFDNFNGFDFCDEDSMSLSDEETKNRTIIEALFYLCIHRFVGL